jgi:hypothetical protein
MTGNKMAMRSAAVDRTAEREGAWVEYGTIQGETFRVKIRRAVSTNAAFLKRSEELTRKYRKHGIELSQVELTKQREITTTLFAETIVVDWNAEDFGCAFSVEECKAAFIGDPDFQDFCVEEANKQANFVKAVREDIAGN